MTEISHNLPNKDYIFCVEKMHGTTGEYEILGITAEESDVAEHLHKFEKTNVLFRISVFTLGMFEGPVRYIYSLEEFESF